MPSYHPRTIEPKWQAYWLQHKTFRVELDTSKPKYYILDMFPYPSGAGLHVGHPEGYTATDILARFYRMRGYNVLHPMGWDAFGLPAEQYAVKTNQHPRITTQANIQNFRRQIQMLGFSYDWDREVDTTDPNYYHWTQWIFLQLYNTWYDESAGKGRPIDELPIPTAIQAAGEATCQAYRDQYRLAYISEAPVNWCPKLGTVLANEEVINGRSERGNHPVVRLPLRQWMLRISTYAQRLLDDLETLDWSEPIKQMQRNWIGRSEGAEVDFLIPSAPDAPVYAQWQQDRQQTGFPETPPTYVVRVFTTRPDTLFGATYMVLAPEHPLVDVITTPEQQAAVAAYRDQVALKSDLERTELAKQKSGVDTGATAINPVNGQAIPIWIADYVLISYGTGAIMAVPGHDERDFAFAKQFQLPIVQVVQNPDQPLAEPLTKAYAEMGVAINSGFLDGLKTTEAKERIRDWLANKGLGRKTVNYKLRDWLFSRQRYWGEPFPILLDEQQNHYPLAENELPLTLPELTDFRPTGTPEPPLAKATTWRQVERDGKNYLREVNTMPQWAGSCWYYLRYIDPHNPERFCDPEKERYWMPVDLYVGGAEHAVLHLLYARFWHKVLYDLGHVSTPEPFQRLVNQGMILGEIEYTGYQYLGEWVSSQEVPEAEKEILHEQSSEYSAVKLAVDQLTKSGEHFVLTENPKIRVDVRAFKMSKSRGNVINPDLVVQQYSADALRLYEMFMGPLEAVKPWNTNGVEGIWRFLNRVWRLIVDDRGATMQLAAGIVDREPTRDELRLLHQTIRGVTVDVIGLRFNTAISKLMEFTNFLSDQVDRPRTILEPFVLLLSPFAPHLGEELWEALGHTNTLAYEPWPSYDEALCQEDAIEVAVQLNSKVRGKIVVPPDADDATIIQTAKADAQIAALLADKQIVKEMVVGNRKGKLINFVVKG